MNSNLTAKELREFYHKYSDLCHRCWACEGEGHRVILDHWADCIDCSGTGIQVDIIKVVRKLLVTDKTLVKQEKL